MRRQVQLSNEDINLAHYIAKRRNINEGHFGARTFGNKKRDSFETHLEGATGELIVARWYGMDPDLVFSDKGGGGKFDNEKGGYTIEVKTTAFFGRLRHGLMVAKHTFKKADVYFLVCAKTVTGYGELVGWTTGEVVESKGAILPDGREDLPLTYIVPEKELRECRVV